MGFSLTRLDEQLTLGLVGGAVASAHVLVVVIDTNVLASAGGHTVVGGFALGAVTAHFLVAPPQIHTSSREMI